MTAICKTATLCDVADDGIFILGPEKGKAYAESIGVEAIIVSPTKQITLTKGLRAVETKWGPAIELIEEK